jgi:glycosyltransferase involved in cell wall biosynthesis
MRIAIDARAADGPPTGIRWYVHTLIHALAASPEENRYLLLRHGASESPPLTPAPRFEDVKLPSPADMWMELHVDEVLAEWQADLFHSPFAPVPGVRPCPGVMTVHDVIPRVLPELVDGAFSRYFRDRMVPSFRHCERLIAVSQHTARDLTHLYGIHPERISIAATAAPPHHVQPIAPDQATEVLARLGISTPYLLYVGAIELRKNVSLLLDAYVLLREADPTAPPLVLVGAARDESDETVRALRRAAGRAPVVWLEYLTSDDLCAVYSQATAFIFPSLYEGFGLPVL